MISYALPMGKKWVDFAELLEGNIDLWWDSGEEFASACGISAASVSRWSRRIGRPTARMLEAMAPNLRDEQGKRMKLADLMVMVYPEPGARMTSGGDPSRRVNPDHPLARELAKMLDPDSPLPPHRRETLETLVDSVMTPYRSLMRKRKTA